MKLNKGMVTPEKETSRKSEPFCSWRAEFPAEMSFDRMDVVLDGEPLRGEFPVTATLEFEDGTNTTVEIAREAVRQTFYITRHDAKTLRIRMPRKMAAKFELFGRTKTDLSDRQKNVQRRRDMPKYTANVNSLREYKTSEPKTLFRTLDQWRTEQRKKKQ